MSDAPIAFDEKGPRLGGVHLLRHTMVGFRPLARTALLEMAGFDGDAGVNLDDPLWPSLTSIARALNLRDPTLAAIVWQRTLSRSRVAAELADRLARFRKAAVDDPEHPGYPAGTPDGKGGQFRPKAGVEFDTGDTGGADDPTADAGGGAVLVDAVSHPDDDPAVVDTAFDPNDDPGVIDAERTDRVGRLLRQRALRAVLTRVLTLKRVVRLLGENLTAGVTEEIPGLDAVTTALAIEDDMKFIRDVASEVRAGEAAMRFVEHGPHDLGEILSSTEDRGFASYDAFKKIDLEKVYGSAGEGQDWHHIVEQSPNVGVIPQPLLQSTNNIVRIPRLLHEELNSFYATKQKIGNEIFVPREYLRGKSFKEQYEFGLYAMRRLGILH